MRFDNIYTQYALKLKRYFIYLTHDNELSEDLVQETFYQAYRSINRFDGSCKMMTWLYQIGRHCYFDYLKKAKHYPASSIDDLIPEPQSSGTVEEDLIQKELLREIYRISAEMGEPHGDVLRLRLFEEMSYADIAEIFGKTETWARVTFFRAKKKLMERLDENGYLV